MQPFSHFSTLWPSAVAATLFAGIPTLNAHVGLGCSFKKGMLMNLVASSSQKPL